MLRAILNKSGRQHPTKHQLYGHLPPVTKTIQVRWARHVGHCWRSRDELISDVLLWTPIYGRAKAGWPARTYIQQLCEDTGGNPEDLPEAMNNREKWRERVKEIRACGTTWWWWSWLSSSSWLALWEMQTSFSRNCTRVKLSISFNEQNYTTCATERNLYADIDINLYILVKLQFWSFGSEGTYNSWPLFPTLL